MNKRHLKVLIIDDSALVREVLTKILSREETLKVIGAAADPLFAVKKIKEQRPDVITLDLNMPRMDGLTFLEKLMSVYPIPVVVISSLAKEGSMAVVKALELGAVDFVTKPGLSIGKGLEELADDIVSKVKSAAAVNMDEIRRLVKINRTKCEHFHKEELFLNGSQNFAVSRTDKIIVIGASTGGTVAVKTILQKLPANMPGIIVVLHMPAGFTASYAENLNTCCRLKVKEAVDREPLMTGCVYIAPGGKHLLLEKGTAGYHIKLDNGPPMNRHKPSVDKTFISAAHKAPSNSLGIILTGMGGDGAAGLRKMHDMGCFTIAQDEKTSIVFGMPRQAIALGAVDKVVSLEDIAHEIISYVKEEIREKKSYG